MKAPHPLQIGNISFGVVFAASRHSHVDNSNIIESNSPILQLYQTLTTCSAISHRGSLTAFSTTGTKHNKITFIFNLKIYYLL